MRFTGHIRTTMGAEEMAIPRESASIDELFVHLLSNKPANLDHGFSPFNTLVVLNGKEVFSAASQRGRTISDGDEVTLVPFSHGG
jgi:molybdopterin converting factor small subunit